MLGLELRSLDDEAEIDHSGTELRVESICITDKIVDDSMLDLLRGTKVIRYIEFVDCQFVSTKTIDFVRAIQFKNCDFTKATSFSVIDAASISFYRCTSNEAVHRVVASSTSMMLCIHSPDGEAYDWLPETVQFQTIVCDRSSFDLLKITLPKADVSIGYFDEDALVLEEHGKEDSLQ